MEGKSRYQLILEANKLLRSIQKTEKEKREAELKAKQFLSWKKNRQRFTEFQKNKGSFVK